MPGRAEPTISMSTRVHVGLCAILIGNAERELGMAGLIGEGCASKAPQSIISIAMGTR